ncbi:MAG: hypothetical protein HKN59_08030 [Gammaproteobacteria bacterium]|nr:hypothetical protein [Gammaproteobacteria bacterium]
MQNSRLVVRSHRPLRSRIILILLIVLLCLGGWGLFEFGRIQGGYNWIQASARFDDLEEQLAGQEEENAALRAQVALLETSRQVDKEAYQQVDDSLADLQAQIQAQREELVFYRGIVSPEDGRSGLQVQELEIIPGDGVRSFRLSLVLIRAIKHDRRVDGVVNFVIEGELDGTPVSLGLSEVGGGGEGPLQFNFRYFQDFEREIVLPEGFTPRKVEVEVNPRTRGVAAVSRSFDWVTS